MPDDPTLSAITPSRFEVEVTFRLVADSPEDAQSRVEELIDGHFDYFGLIVSEGEA